MCCFAGPVERVSNTKIYVAPNAQGTRQVTVYEMEVKLAGKANAMILPCPAPVDTIRLLDLTTAENFFDHLASAMEPPSRGISKSWASAGMLDDLEVMDVGSYKVSLAPTIDDLDRLNPLVFQVSEATKDALRASQGDKKFGFVVAVLTTSGEYHPLAYTHDLVDGQLFIPTRHEHGHADATPPYWMTKPNSETPRSESAQFAEWDHEIYYVGGPRVTPLIARDGIRTTTSTWGDWYIKKAIREIQPTIPELVDFLHPDMPLSRMTFKGNGRNVDTQVALVSK